MSQEEIYLTEDKGVVKKILQEGTGTETPNNGANIKVTYIGTLENGEQFDASTDKENPFEFQVGVGQVIKGWDLGMVTMKKGERALFTLAPEYAYGASGSGKIPANATLKFEVEMLDWYKNKGDYSESERYEAAAERKKAGNEYFKKGEFEKAIVEYGEGEEWLETMYDQEQAIKDQLVIRNNMAMVWLKMKQYENAVNYANKVLEKEPSNEKALFRRAQAFVGQKEYEQAKNDLKLLYEQDNKNNTVIAELQKVQKLIKEAKAQEKKKFGGLFSGGIYNDKKDAQIKKVVANPSDPSNPKVFMDIKIGDAEPERVEYELYKNIVPKTAENFLELCKTKYKNAIFHRNIASFMIQGGDYENRNGTGGKSIYGEKFEDENFNVEHTKRGQLSMANAGPNTNGSQFFILYTSTPHLDGKHVVFGEISKNIEFLDKLEAAKTGAQDKPLEDIVIVDCGVVE